MGSEGRRRPVFFNLARISLPVGALASIAHRVAGVILAVGLPFAVYALDLSLQDPRGYAVVAAASASAPLRLGIVMLVWALAHHLLAGIRHLLMDIGVGSRLADARRSAWVVNVAGLAIAVLAAGVLL